MDRQINWHLSNNAGESNLPLSLVTLAMLGWNEAVLQTYRHCYKNSTIDGMFNCLACVRQLSVCWSDHNCCVELAVNCDDIVVGWLLLQDAAAAAGGMDWWPVSDVSCNWSRDDVPTDTTTCDLFLFESCDNSWWRAPSELAGTSVPTISQSINQLIIQNIFHQNNWPRHMASIKEPACIRTLPTCHRVVVYWYLQRIALLLFYVHTRLVLETRLIFKTWLLLEVIQYLHSTIWSMRITVRHIGVLIIM